MTRLILLVIFSIFSALSSAQTTLLDQSMLSQQSFDTFTTYSVTGTQVWHSTIYGAVCSGYQTPLNYENEDWLISPEINLTQTNNVKLTFEHTRGVTAVMNVGVTLGWYTAFATANYTGDPATTQWYELSGLNQNIPVGWQFIASGELVLPEAAKSENSRIAFRYKSSATQSASWEIKNIKVVGEPQGSSPNAGIFKITNWNTEWLGCTQFGPEDEALQISNVAAAMLAIDSDIYCIQEVSNTANSPSIATLVSLLGSDIWEGNLVPSATGDCDQRQGIIYKKARVQFVNSAQLSTGNAAQGNSYYYNWSSGRYPSLYSVNLISGSTVVPLSIVNIHAKAEDGNASSYTRRLGGSQALKTILDGSTFNGDNLILVGDFNDYMVGTSSTACVCTDSPYKNFTDDTTNYSCITQTLMDAHHFNTHPVIENMVLSNELAGNYIAGSATQEIAVSQNIGSYYTTTSDHLPASARFQFSVLGKPDFSKAPRTNWTIYPNPVKNELQFDAAGLANNTAVSVYDMTGRQMRCEKAGSNALNVSQLPTGIYIVKAGGRSAKFTKE